MKKLLPLMLCALLNTQAWSADDLSHALQTGLLEEEANQNLPAAIEAYEKVLLLHATQRQMAATAVFRLGECYRKLNRTNDAVMQYEQVLREYPDQKPLAALSEQNLAALGLSPASSALSPTMRAKQRELLSQEIQLLEGDLARMEKMVENGVAPPASLIPVRRDLLRLQRELLPLEEAPAGTASIPTDEEEQEVRRIQALIKNSPDLINAQEKTALTPLGTAAGKGQLRVARFLLENGARVNAGSSPLYQAAEAGHKAMVELLLSHGADVALQGGNWTGTPLHAAAEHGFLEVIKVLLDASAPLNATDRLGKTPLHHAISEGHLLAAELLLQQKPDLSLQTQRLSNPSGLFRGPASGTALHLAIRNPKMTELLLRHNADPNTLNVDGYAPLHAAVAHGSDLVARLLIENGAQVDLHTEQEGDYKGWTPLHCAALKNNSRLAELLLQSGANPDSLATVKESGCQNETPLLVATREANSEVVEVLLKHKANPNATNSCGQSPLLRATEMAVANRNRSMAALLIQGGANPDIGVSNRGATPLLLATIGHDTSLTELFLANQANPNIKHTDGGMTPLHLLVSQAVSRQQQVSRRPPTPRTTLPQNPSPADQDHITTARLLLANGADANAKDSLGRTPLNYMGVPARPEGATSKALADLLREHGAIDALPELPPNPATIRVWREGLLEGREVFHHSTNWSNTFTIMDVLLELYTTPSIAKTPNTLQGRLARMSLRTWPDEFDFPDLSLLRLRRLQPDGSYSHTPVNIFGTDHSVNCSSDAAMRFGDVLEIPLREHALADNPVGLTREQQDQISSCRQGSVRLLVDGTDGHVPLSPGQSRYLSKVLQDGEARKRLSSNSDLSKVTVRRGKAEFIVDTTSTEGHEDLLLDDGDEIEVPEK